MSKFERYWVHASIYILMAATFGDGDRTVINSIAIGACYALSAGYFIAMIITHFKGESE